MLFMAVENEYTEIVKLLLSCPNINVNSSYILNISFLKKFQYSINRISNFTLFM